MWIKRSLIVISSRKRERLVFEKIRSYFGPSQTTECNAKTERYTWIRTIMRFLSVKRPKYSTTRLHLSSGVVRLQLFLGNVAPKLVWQPEPDQMQYAHKYCWYFEKWERNYTIYDIEIKTNLRVMISEVRRQETVKTKKPAIKNAHE